MRSAIAVAASLVAIVAWMVVPVRTAQAAEPSPSPVDELADGLPHPDRVLAPDQQLGAGWHRSSDRAVTTAGDETGLHVLVADRREAYRWRTVATLAEPAIESDQWIGQLCVTGSGGRAVVVYAPRDFSNDPLLMERGAFAAVIDLATGEVTKLAERVTLAYYNPSCGAGETAVLSRLEQSPAAGIPAQTWLGTVDTVAGELTSRVRADGQLTSAVPVSGRIVAARGYGLVAVDADGRMTTVAHTNGAPLRLLPEGETGLAFQIARWDDTDLARLVDGAVRTVATVPLGAVKLRPGAGGDVYAVGIRASQRVGASAPPAWRVVDALPDSEPSTDGGLVVTRARTMREATGQIGTGTGLPGTVQIAATLDSGAESLFTAPAGAGAAGRGASPALGSPAGAPGGARPAQDDSAVPWDPDRACAVPRNDPTIQVYQPSPEQVEWAADLAVRGQLTFNRPANWLNNGLPAYSPQGLFPRLALAGGGGDVPAQVFLGILAQESNLWQATFHVVDALAGNPLTSSGFYGLDWENPDPTEIDWSKVDCGYGAAQVTTGMHRDDTGQVVDGLVMSELRQEAVVLDYATNVSAGLRILQSKWNQTRNAGIIANDGEPHLIENWFLAAWAYNSGVQPDERFGNDTGCTPSPSCTDDHGNWGLGWSNNPASPLYPEDRRMFLTAPLDHPDVDPPDEIGYDNAKHPNHWSYPERIMGWAYTSLIRWDYASQSWEDTYWSAGDPLGYEDVQPHRLTFCVASANHCDPDAPPQPPSEFPGYPATLCQRDDLRCWWHDPVTWEPDCDIECGIELRRYTTVEPRPLADAIYDSQCGTAGLPAGARIIDDIDSASPLGPQGCSRTWPVGGSFSLRFESMTGPQGTPIYPGKWDLHQIGGGFGGHFWFTHTRKEVGNEHLRATGRWTVSPVNAWARVLVHVPDHGAHTQQALYKIHLPSGGEPKHRAITQHLQRHEWVDIGVFDFRGTGNPVIELSNFTTDGVGVHDVAWDAVAVQPLPAKPDHFVVAMGDSYSSGEGSFDYYPESYQYLDDGSHDGSFRNICRRSPVTWSRQIQLDGAPGSLGDLKDSLHNDLDYHLLACAGARTHHMLGTEITFPGQPVQPNPLGNLPEGPQNGRELTGIDRGFLDENTTLVMLNIGGNDAGWTDVLGTCITGDFDCHNDDDFRSDVIDLISGPVPAAVAQVMEQIAEVAPNARIFLVGYPQLFSEGTLCWSPIFTGAEREFLNNLAQIFAVNTVLDHSVFDPTGSGRSFGVRVTEVDFGPVCQLFVDYPGQGINGVRFENPPFYWEGAGDGSFHPKTRGYEVYGNVVGGALTGRGYVW